MALTTSTNSDADILLDETAVADLICHSVRTIQKWRATGQGPQFFKLGRSVRYRRGDILTWIECNRRPNTASRSRRAARTRAWRAPPRASATVPCGGIPP